MGGFGSFTCPQPGAITRPLSTSRPHTRIPAAGFSTGIEGGAAQRLGQGTNPL